jgi:Ran GTPase-activating protein (RanGAP) involved in mRNA processing and transport
MTTETCDNIISNINIQNITCLVIKNNQFNKIILFKNLIESLIAKDSLIKFIFSNNQTLTGFDEGWKIIIKLISSTNKLKILNFSLNYVYDKYLDEIFKALKKKKIISLDLSSNFITSHGAKIIANWVLRNKTLKSLNLEQNTMNEFKRDGSDFIMEAVKTHPQIAYLNLSYMILTGFCEKLALAVKTTKSLKVLKIRNTRMNLDDHQFLFSALLENESIEELDIGENPSGVDKSVEFLSIAIEKVRKLKEFNLEKFGIGKKMQDVFFNALRKNKSLEKLFLNNNKIIIKPLLEALAECVSLKEVNISNKEFDYSFSEKEEIESFMKENSHVVITYLAPEKKLNSTRGFGFK